MEIVIHQYPNSFNRYVFSLLTFIHNKSKITLLLNTTIIELFNLTITFILKKLSISGINIGTKS